MLTSYEDVCVNRLNVRIGLHFKFVCLCIMNQCQ